MQYDGPLPDFGTRYPGKLESCLEQPFQTFAGEDLYPGLVSKVAVIFYLIIKNYPFENGNKRIAVSTSLVFLYVNNCWLAVSPETLYKIALTIAKSKPKDKDKMLVVLRDFFEKFLLKR